MIVERRTEVSVPYDLGAQAVEIAEGWKHQLSTLLYGWFEDAAQLAAAGRGDELPRALPRSHPDMAGPVKRMWFKQGKREFDHWSALLKASGSSLRAVETEAVQAYVDAGGDLLAMSWTRFPVPVEAVA